MISEKQSTTPPAFPATAAIPAATTPDAHLSRQLTSLKLPFSQGPGGILVVAVPAKHRRTQMVLIRPLATHFMLGLRYRELFALAWRHETPPAPERLAEMLAFNAHAFPGSWACYQDADDQCWVAKYGLELPASCPRRRLQDAIILVATVANQMEARLRADFESTSREHQLTRKMPGKL